MYPMIHIGPLNMSGYWLMSVLGLIVCAVYLFTINRSGRLASIEGHHLVNLCFLSILSGIAGGKIMGVLVNLPDVIQNWADYGSDWAALWTDLTSGRAFYGGFLLIMGVFIWYIRKHDLSVDAICGLFVPAAGLFMVFGRLGCFLGGCCYGIPVQRGIVFPEGSLAPSGVPLFPSQLVEGAIQLLLFILLTFLERHLTKKWLLAPAYIASYAAIRFVLEFWRGDSQRGIWLLSSSQWVSLALLAGICILAIFHLFKGRRASS